MEDNCVNKWIISSLSTNGTSELATASDIHGICKQICFVGSEFHRDVMDDIKQSLCLPILHSPDGMEYLGTNIETIYVMDDFESESFQKVISSNSRILGVTYLKELILKNLNIDVMGNPVFCHSMSGMTINFTGFECKTTMTRLINLVGFMGGTVSMEISSETTNLVSNCCWSNEIEHAVTLNMPILMSDWIHFCWENRYEVGFSAQEVLDEFIIKPFTFVKMHFYGFDQDEQNHLTALLLEYGGSYASSSEEDCTHVVVKECLDDGWKSLTTCGIFIRLDWFWLSIQHNHFVNPRAYILEKGSKILFDESYDQAVDKGEETVSDSGLGDDDLDSFASLKTPRAQLISEFIQTETNYVSILDTIMQIKNEVACTKKNRSPLLSVTEVRTIFSGIDSIQELHHSLLKDLEEEFRHADDETFPIGKILLKHASGMFKVYPPFVNFFERALAALQCCETQNSKFHAYLASWQSRPECGRQSLRELMIRPVQRLGSCVLLVKSILKHTDENNIDHPHLKKALSQILEAVSNIDRDKERTQNMCHIFDIFNSIEECPPNLVSSSRNVLFILNVIDANGFEKCGHHFQLFVFSDLIEICKVKTCCQMPSPRRLASMKGPLGKGARGKNLKHWSIITFSMIHGIIDFSESERAKDTFGVVAKDESLREDKVMCFSILQSETIKKDEAILKLCRAIAVHRCIKDPMSILYEVNPNTLDSVTAVRSGFSAKALNVFKSPMNICKTHVKMTKDVLAFLHLQDSMRSNALSSSCSHLVETVKLPGNDVVRSVSLPAKRT